MLARAPFGALLATVRLGDEQPNAALARIGPTPDDGADPETTRARLLARGLVLASNGREREARQSADALRALDPGVHGMLGLAAAELVLAQWYDTDGQNERSQKAARASLHNFEAGCQAGCEPLPRWLAEVLALRALGDAGETTLARQHLELARTLAASARDPVAQALTEVEAAWQFARENQAGPASARLEAAQQFAAAAPPDPALQVRLLNAEGLVAIARNDLAVARSALRAALAVAETAGFDRIGAVVNINLADLDLRQRAPADALAALALAEAPIRAHQDRRRERTLLHNRGLARIALGDLAGGRRDVDQAQELWLVASARGEARTALREAGEALAAAGDYAGALAMVHRESDLAAEAMRANRDAALAEVQTRFQRTAQEREIELKAREQALRAASLDNQRLQQRLWALIVAAVLAAVSVTVLLLRRLRRTQSALGARQALLRERSERDALTGLSNRRHLQSEFAHGTNPDGTLAAGLLLLDIDRFKQINDSFGHAAGDHVLRVVSARLVAQGRVGDRIARWGGEEFVVVRPAANAAEVEALALSLLDAVGTTPVPLLDGRACPVTLSIGWATFPLPPHALTLPWGQAISLVDRLLYRAKESGRNQAQGLIAAPGVTEAAALRGALDPLDTALADGLVTLRRLDGPALPEPAASAFPGPTTPPGDARQGLRTRTL
ncbi:MAG: GGDEF domain-containing protein [Rubrivivax sp.]